jgi:hypothetical protein
VKDSGRAPFDFSGRRASIQQPKSILTPKVDLALKPLILLGFVSLWRLPKTAYSGYNHPYFSWFMSYLSRHICSPNPARKKLTLETTLCEQIQRT